MGVRESRLAMLLGHFLLEFVLPRHLGVILGSDGTIRLEPGQIRAPDVAFYRRDRLPLPFDELPPIPDIWPDLAIEVLSPSNTKREMARKLDEYFAAGTELVWYVDPKTETVRVYTEPSEVSTLGRTDSLDGGNVLPGFLLPLDQLFADSYR